MENELEYSGNKLISRKGTGNKSYLLSDFGISVKLDETRYSLEEGDMKYMPEEVIFEDTQNLDLKMIDIFSFGVVIFKTMTNFDLPSGGESWQILRESPNEFSKLIGATKYRETLKCIILSCLQRNPKNRPTSSSLMASLNNRHENITRIIQRRQFYSLTERACNIPYRKPSHFELTGLSKNKSEEGRVKTIKNFC